MNYKDIDVKNFNNLMQFIAKPQIFFYYWQKQLIRTDIIKNR